MDRRTYLVALGGCLAGCSFDATSRPTRTLTPAPVLDTASSPTDTNEFLRVRDFGGPSTVPLGRPLTVFPTALQRLLRRAALTGETVRGHGESWRLMPDPILLLFDHDAIRLRTPEGDADGLYRLNIEGGTRYSILVGAERVESVPDGVTVTPIAVLPPERRDLARTAIDGAPDARVYPETRLGEWVRNEFFDGYFRAGGETYRGHEVQQTDVAFFSTEVWYVLSLSPVEADARADPVELRLPRIDSVVREVIGALLDGLGLGQTRTVAVADSNSTAIRRFAETTEFLLTHTDIVSLEMTRS